jgi:amidohydrolase
MACRDSFKIKILGRGSHGAWPETSVDPIAIGTQVINGIYMIKAREISALDPAVISITMIHGGTANNIIPDTIEIEGTSRSINPKTREKIAERIAQVIKHTCEAHGATYEFDYNKGYDITINNPVMADLVISAAHELGCGSDVIPQTSAVMGAEDMSFFLNEVPGAYFFLSSVVNQDGQVFGHHNPKFMLDESVFQKGVAMFVQIVRNYLG